MDSTKFDDVTNFPSAATEQEGGESVHDQEPYHIAHIHGKMIGDFIVRLKNGSLEFFNDRNNPFEEPLDKRTPDVLLLPHEAAELKKFLETCLPDGE
jgi:hypothetical protein